MSVSQIARTTGLVAGVMLAATGSATSGSAAASPSSDEAFLQAAKAGPGDVVEYTIADVNVRVHGDAAMVTAVGSWRRKDGTTGKTRYIDAYVRTASGWQVVSAQLTKVTIQE